MTIDMTAKQTSMIIAMATVIQLPLLFIGFDLADTGQYMTFYEQIFKAPESVEYHFIYYLSGVVGGIWHLAWPGLLSIRVLALLCNLWVVWVLTRILPDWRPVMLTVMAVLFGNYGSPMSFYYDTLTVALAVTGIWFILISRVGSWKWPLLAGVVMGVNVFSRVSNLAGIGYILFFFITAVWRGRRMMFGAAWFLVGWLLGMGLTMILMAVLGHIPVFMQGMKELIDVADSSGDEATHGLVNLIMVQFHVWWRVFKFACVAGVLLMSFLWLRRKPLPRWIGVSLVSMIALAGLYVMYRANPVTVAAAVGMAGCLAAFCNSREECMWDRAVAGLLMLLIVPLGADGGIFNNGTIATWLALAAAMDYCVNTRNVRIRWLVPGFAAASALTVAYVLLIVFNVARRGVYFDDSSLGDNFASVSGEIAYTSVQRKRVIDALVKELNHFVQPGDTLMVYGSAPMLNYLTHTQPWIGTSWPESTTRSYLSRHIADAKGHPVIAIVKFNTIGPGFGSPTDDFARGGGEQHFFHNRAKSAVIYEFIESHGYRPVYDGEYMVIYR